MTDSGGTPVSGTHDLELRLYDVGTGGTALDTETINGVTIANGLFTVAPDFGADIFNGDDRWLEISDLTTATVFPRQKLTPTPYAIYAGKSATLDGALPANQLSGIYSNNLTLNNPANQFIGQFTGDGGMLTNLNVGTLGGLGPSNFWQTAGNAGTTAGTRFLGTTDNQPLELKVNNLRALRIEDNGDGSDSGTTPDGAPNLIGGSRRNLVAPGVVGATIAGGGAANYEGISQTNAVLADYSIVGGGLGNRVEAGSFASVVLGGWLNHIGTNSSRSSIVGGFVNEIVANSPYATIGGGAGNKISTNADYSTIGGGEGGFVGWNSLYATIAGGTDNYIGNDSGYSAIGGGSSHFISSGTSAATISGGSANIIRSNSFGGTISGGSQNTIDANARYATIPGGLRNDVAGEYGFAAGRRAQANHTGAFVWADSTDADFASTANDQFLIRASGGVGIGTTAPDAPLHVTGGFDVTVSTGGNIISGSTNGSNIAMDGNEIMARNNGNTATLSLNANGGNISLCQGSGNVSINSATLDSPLRVFAARCDGATWIDASDRNLKSGFAAVDAGEVLEKVVRLPVTRWRYRKDAATEHLGPVAQDFHAAFGLGSDDVSIASVDAHGVALAAIQGLNQKLTEELKRRDAENAELKARLTALENVIATLNLKGN